VFDASPQFTDDAKKAGLIDKVGYDDDAMQAALDQAGSGSKPVPMANTSTPRKRCASSAGAITSL